MKKYLGIIAAGFLLLSPLLASAQVSGSLWKLASNELVPVNATWSLLMPYLAGSGTVCVTVNNSGDFGTTTCSGGGGGGGIATTSLAATSPIILTVTSANATFSWAGLATTTNLTSSQLLESNGASGVFGVSTSTLTASFPLTGSFAQVGTGGSLGCQTASGSQAGCLSSTDWTTFNNKGSGSVTSVATNNGITGGTITTTGTLSLDQTFGAVWTAASSTYTGHLALNTASTTQLTAPLLWTGLTAFNLLSTDANGKMVATSSIGNSLLTNSSIVVTTASPLGGAATVPLGGTLALTCSTCSTATGANPSVNVTLSVQNGSASTFMRSDAAPAIDQTISPTWTGTHTFNTSPTIGVNTNGLLLGGNVFAYASSTNHSTIFGSGAGGTSATTTATADDLTAVGYLAGSAMITGTGSTAIGSQALLEATSSPSNTAVGFQALKGNTPTTVFSVSGDNVAVGYKALTLTTSGNQNVALGFQAARGITTGAQNVVIGQNAGNGVSAIFQDGIGNVLLGAFAGDALVNSETDNILIGIKAGHEMAGTNAGNIEIGPGTEFPTATVSHGLNIGNVLYGKNMGDTTGSGLFSTNGSIGVSTSTPWGKLSINANSGDTFGLVFEIASSTATATTTLFSVTNTGHIIASSTNPVLSSCGTSPTMKGDDTHGTVTVGSVATGCTITFQIPYSATPECVVQNQTGSVTNTFGYTLSSTAITVTETALGGDILNYQCEGFTGS
jgi:hypothetical protein